LTSNGPIGVLGGTFDPIHLAHLRLAEELADTFGLTRVRFIPAAVPPHRGTPSASAQHRLDMVRLAVADNPRFEIDSRELARQGPSYTFDTVRELRAEIDRPLCLLMGTDAFVAFATWHRWRELLELVHIVVARRPGYPLQDLAAALPAVLKAEYLGRHCSEREALTQEPGGRIFTHELTALDVSASALRKLIARGKSLRYLLPDAVIAYIENHRLYKETNAS
jgi:nicotinate-nucleotide adenylyltransferase